VTWGWIGVDLNGTLVRKYNGAKGKLHIGPLVPRMAMRVREWLTLGIEVRIVTALSAEEGGREAVEEWSLLKFGVRLRATDRIDSNMLEYWNDRCVQVERDTGRPICKPKNDPLASELVDTTNELG
jgi:hypothetical protein